MNEAFYSMHNELSRHYLTKTYGCVLFPHKACLMILHGARVKHKEAEMREKWAKQCIVALHSPLTVVTGGRGGD